MSFAENVRRIEELKQELADLLPLRKEDEAKLWEKFRLEWNYNSNHIEGNTLTYGETKMLLIFGDTIGIHQYREYEEMKAHDVAIKLIKEWADDKMRDLTEAEIRQLNKILLVEPFFKEAITTDGQPTRRQIQPGEYKEFQNSVQLTNGEIFEYASPADVPPLMKKLMDWYYTGSVSLHPAQRAAELHYRFIRIHPFDDGNGRVARLLVNYVLMKEGYSPIVIKSKDKNNYFTALRIADAGNIEPFCDYIAKELIWSTELTLKAAKGESVDEPEDLDKKITLLEKELENVSADDSINIQLSEEILLQLLDSWIFDLLKKLVLTTQKFTKFFVGASNHNIQINNLGSNIVAINFTNEQADQIIKDLKQQLIKEIKRINYQGEIDIHFQTFYGTFKKAGLKTFGCNYGFNIKFDFTKYEIFMDEFDEGRRKNIQIIEPRLLHKPLTSLESDLIASKLGEAIYNHIDYYTKDIGLR